MIIGIGNDYIDIRRIEKAINRFGERFINRVFTENEKMKANKRAANQKSFVSTYAKRFAAKEACSKALGTGIAKEVSWQDIEVVNLPSGQPILNLYGGAARRLKELTPEGYSARLNITLSDDYPKAQAIVIISAE